MNARVAYGAVILAAGASSRLGVPKQLVELNGQSLLERTIDSIATTIDGPLIVVTGAQHAAIHAALSSMDQPRLKICQNHNWQDGMGNSIACGVEMLNQIAPDIDGVCIAVCDQPNLTSAVISALLEFAQAAPSCIIASNYGAAQGPPVYFPSRFIPELCSLHGDHGAKAIIRNHTEALRTVPFPQGGFDLDTPSDLEKLHATLNQ